jgi:hypothetical protein
MPLRVDLRVWGKRNLHYIAGWICMGLALLAAVIRELGIYTLVLVGPFLPFFLVSLKRIREELRR